MEIVEVLILVFSFVILLGIGVPVAWSIGLSGLITLFVSIDSLAAFTTMAQRMVTALDSFTLLAIPFFILAGELINRGGLAHRLIALAKNMMGSLPGGLAHVNVVASMLFGAIAGSAIAAASAIGSILAPRMEEEGYSREFGAAVNITA
ncbi:MAG: TRAP transporter large permease subunit, partial [Balneolales bacterium]